MTIMDDRILYARDTALEELKNLLGAVNYEDMEPCEVVAFVTLLRPVYERVVQKIRDDMPPVEPIPLKVVQEPRNRKQPAHV
jgi:hypothetical protein